MRRHFARALIGALLAVSSIVLAVGPAAAFTLSTGTYQGNHGDIDYNCAYQASLPSTDVTTVNVALTASARNTPHQTTNPAFATAVSCWLSRGTGSAGLTMPGASVVAAGTASFKIEQNLPLPNVCYQASTVYLAGQSDTTPVKCSPIDGSLLKIDQ